MSRKKRMTRRRLIGLTLIVATSCTGAAFAIAAADTDPSRAPAPREYIKTGVQPLRGPQPWERPDGNVDVSKLPDKVPIVDETGQVVGEIDSQKTILEREQER